MPLVRISVGAGWNQDRLAKLSDAVHTSLVEAISAPAEGKFHIVTEHPAHGLVHPPSYMGMPKTDGLVILQITMNIGRTPELKRALYAKLAERVHAAAGVAPDDLIISLVEIPKENWSWGRGEMTYVKA